MTGYRETHVGALMRRPDLGFVAFGLAVLTSLAIHGAAILVVPGEKPHGVQNFGHGGITVSLGPAGRDAGGELATGQESVEAVEEEPAAVSGLIEASDTLETVPAETVSTNSVSAVPEPDVLPTGEVTDTSVVEAVDVETPETDPVEVEAVTAAEAEVTEIALTEAPVAVSAEVVVMDRVAPPPLPRRRPEQVKKPLVQEPPKTEIAEISPKAIHRETKQSDAETALEQPKQTHQKTAGGDTSTQTTNQVAGQGGRSGESGLSEVGQGDNTAGGGAPGVDSDYYREVLAWLEKHKRYPRRSKLRHEQGIVLLRFVVNRDGMVTVSAIKKSSGHKRLDKEAMGMIERAQPLPAMPDDMRQAKLRLVVPVKFYLQ